VAGPQTAAAATPREAPTSTPRVLDDAQRALLRVVLNCLIPARGDLPAAGDLGVSESIERTLASTSALRRLFFEGLVEIDLTSGRLASAPLASLGTEAQTEVLQEIERAQPSFFTALVEHTYRGYYTLPRVHAAIGWESRPPQPLGHRLAPFDPALLAIQRRRPPFWRRTNEGQGDAG